MTPDIGILTGKAGRDAAFADPDNWEARSTLGNWHGSSGSLGWLEWTAFAVLSSDTQWRRKPVEKREPMRYVVRPIELHDDIIVGEPNGHFVDVNLRLPFAWNRRVATITVNERIDAQPTQQPAEDYRPCTQAEAEVNPEHSQMRYRCNNEPELSWSRWVSLTDEQYKGYETLDYEFQTRVTLQPAQPEAVEMEREIDDLKKQVAARDRRLETKRILDDRDEAEWKAFVEWSQNRYNDKTLEDKTFAICGDSHIAAARKTIEGLSALVDTERTTLTSALGSQKAAVAALEVERAKTTKLRSALQDCVATLKVIPSVAGSIRFADRILNETAGKESGG